MEAELQEILVQVSELQRWRLPSTHGIKLLDAGKEEEHQEAPPTHRPLPPLCSIPRRLVVSPSLGGTPVTPQLTTSLRRILFGGTFHVFNYQWRKSFFQFRELKSESSFALETDGGGARPIQMVVQARVIKHLLFCSDGRTLDSLTQVGRTERDVALAAALSESLWLAGQEVRATVTLVTQDYCITPQLDYKLDNFTERLQLFTFEDKEEVRKFILERIQSFTEEGSHGVILFLYSLICSRTVDRLKEDLDSSSTHLLFLSLGNFVCRQPLLNLLLTGRASPHVFNGPPCVGGGALSRSDVGFLHWSGELLERLPQVGSMLKTPRFPVWVCRINDSHSVLFGPSRSLLSDWRTERRFHLFYYNGLKPGLVRLTVDTHSHHWEAPSTDSDPERRFPSLEMTIRTKWAGAVIHWNGTEPFY